MKCSVHGGQCHLSQCGISGCVDHRRTVPSPDPRDEGLKPINPPNPKQRYGDLKPDLSLVPAVAMAHAALAHENGAVKYGPYNWRDKAVEARTYVAAAIRHLHAWLDGEENSVDTVAAGKPVHNLGHVIACCAILLDAMEQGNLIDNRPMKGKASEMQERVRQSRLSPPEPKIITDVIGELDMRPGAMNRIDVV